MRCCRVRWNVWVVGVVLAQVSDGRSSRWAQRFVEIVDVGGSFVSLSGGSAFEMGAISSKVEFFVSAGKSVQSWEGAIEAW